MSYRQILDDEIGASPVSTIDVDAVITRQRRAGRLRRWGAAGAGAAAVLAVTVVAGQILPDAAPAPLPGGPQPTPSAPPRPQTGQTRIDDAVFASLRSQAADVRGDRGSLEATWTGAGGDNTEDSYWGQGRVLVGGVIGLFSVQVERVGPVPDPDLTCGEPSATYTCETGTGPRGEQYRTVVNTSKPGEPNSATRDVHVLRTDGTWLVVSLVADPPAATFLLTAPQQQAVALDPAITLAPR